LHGPAHAAENQSESFEQTGKEAVAQIVTGIEDADFLENYAHDRAKIEKIVQPEYPGTVYARMAQVVTINGAHEGSVDATGDLPDKAGNVLIEVEQNMLSSSKARAGGGGTNTFTLNKDFFFIVPFKQDAGDVVAEPVKHAPGHGNSRANAITNALEQAVLTHVDDPSHKPKTLASIFSTYGAHGEKNTEQHLVKGELVLHYEVVKDMPPDSEGDSDYFVEVDVQFGQTQNDETI
jgi:hypothetical protein